MKLESKKLEVKVKMLAGKVNGSLATEKGADTGEIEENLGSQLEGFEEEFGWSHLHGFYLPPLIAHFL